MRLPPPAIDRPNLVVYQGHALDVLRALPDGAADCCVTSPPYYAQRNYGGPEQVWDGGAWRGHLGLEPDYLLFVEHIRQIFAEVFRVLKPGSTLWLNFGDTYATGAGSVGNSPGGEARGEKFARHYGKHSGNGNPRQGQLTTPNRYAQPNLKRGDLMGIPWRVALALQDDGWWLRSDIVWHKRNAMPENVDTRPSRVHEYVFLLANAAQYHYDAEAIREPVTGGANPSGRGSRQKMAPEKSGVRNNPGFNAAIRSETRADLPKYRNKRTVWPLVNEQNKLPHYATYPKRLIRPCILAGCPPGGVVLDPFMGTGTTAIVAHECGCKALGVELHEDYVELIRENCRQKHLGFGK